MSLESCHRRVSPGSTEVVDYIKVHSGKRPIYGASYPIAPGLDPVSWHTYYQRLLLDYFISGTAQSSRHPITTISYHYYALPSCPKPWKACLCSPRCCLASIYRQSTSLAQSTLQITYLRWNLVKILRTTLTPGTVKRDCNCNIALAVHLRCFCGRRARSR
jgi:hypothetical protein